MLADRPPSTVATFSPPFYASARGTRAEYRDEHVCLSVCLSVCVSVCPHERSSGTAPPNYNKLSVCISYGRGSVFLRRRCYICILTALMLGCVASRPVIGWRLPPSNSTQVGVASAGLLNDELLTTAILLPLHPFNCLFSRTTRVSRFQKSKTGLDLNGQKEAMRKEHTHQETSVNFTYLNVFRNSTEKTDLYSFLVCNILLVR